MSPSDRHESWKKNLCNDSVPPPMERSPEKAHPYADGEDKGYAVSSIGKAGVIGSNEGTGWESILAW